MSLFTEEFLKATPFSSHPVLLVAIVLLSWILTHHLMNKNRPSEEDKAESQILRPEPPPAHSKIPFIGHVYGLMSKRLAYVTSLRSLAPTGICTLAFPFLPRIYIVTALHQVQDIQKNGKLASFSAVGSRVCSKLGGVTNENHHLLLTNPAAVDISQASFFSDARKAIRASVSSGPAHDNVLRTMETEMRTMYETLREEVGGGKEKKMEIYEWLKEHVCLISTNSIYGPHNPFLDEEIVEAFWAFNGSAIPMLAIPDGLLPFVARKGWKGRNKMVAAFQKYLSSGHHLEAADVIIERQKVMDKYNVSLEDRARIETMNCIAILENTIPSVFWTLYNTITRPELLKQVRQAAEIYIQRDDINGPPKVNLSNIRHDPLLYAIISESVRCISNSQESRYVHDEDVILDCGYRLKKNSLVLMPSRALHMDDSIFRPTAAASDPTVFDHTRFLKSMSKDGQKVSFTPSGYRGFGAGDSLCPGRHLATAEVLGIVALLVSCFDIEVVEDGQGPLNMTFEQLSLGFPRPNREVWVSVRERSISGVGV